MECLIFHGTDPNEIEVDINQWLTRSEKDIPGFSVIHIKQSIAPPDSPGFSKERPGVQPDLEPWLVVSIWFERNFVREEV